MRRLLLAAGLVVASVSAADAETFERLAIGCRASSLMDDVVTAFEKSDGPELLNTLVRSKDCQWLKAGTKYTVTKTRPTSIAREIELADSGAALWVPKQFLAANAGAKAQPSADAMPEIDNDTIVGMATMSASLTYARENCKGSADPNALGAVELITKMQPGKMRVIEEQALVMVRQQAAKVGVSQQCENIAVAFGPNGTVNKGAWRPAKR
jgi:hypothetical protein